MVVGALGSTTVLAVETPAAVVIGVFCPDYQPSIDGSITPALALATGIGALLAAARHFPLTPRSTVSFGRVAGTSQGRRVFAGDKLLLNRVLTANLLGLVRLPTTDHILVSSGISRLTLLLTTEHG